MLECFKWTACPSALFSILHISPVIPPGGLTPSGGGACIQIPEGRSSKRTVAARAAIHNGRFFIMV